MNTELCKCGHGQEYHPVKDSFLNGRCFNANPKNCACRKFEPAEPVAQEPANQVINLTSDTSTITASGFSFAKSEPQMLSKCCGAKVDRDSHLSRKGNIVIDNYLCSKCGSFCELAPPTVKENLTVEPAKTENPEPELTPEPEQVTALEPTQTKRLIAGGFNQGAKSQLLRSQIELPAIKIYWYNKGFEAGGKYLWGKITPSLHRTEQLLAKKLGYPWYKDDQKNFPGATEADGVCIGEGDYESLAMQAARQLEAGSKPRVPSYQELWDLFEKTYDFTTDGRKRFLTAILKLIEEGV